MAECKDCYLSEEEKLIKRIAKRRFEELQSLPAIILKKYSLKDIEDELMAEYMHRNVHREGSTIDNPPTFPIH